MQERLYENKVNGSLVSNFNCKMAYYVTIYWCELWVLWTKLSQQNKAKNGRLSIPLALTQKSMEVQILQKYESTSALNFLSWCVKEFTF